MRLTKGPHKRPGSTIEIANYDMHPYWSDGKIVGYVVGHTEESGSTYDYTISLSCEELSRLVEAALSDANMRNASLAHHGKSLAEAVRTALLITPSI